MIRTLHTYISRDLAKVTLLALVAFTLVMTVFAIIEPLRKQGLAADQVAALFAYTLPVMLSLTFPIAALFAATIVYGRFSQENELMACRASGISTLALLRPAIVLGAAVTVISLVLSNFVAPKMVARGAKAIEANVRGIAYRQLGTGKALNPGTLLIHANTVDADTNTLHGVVVADTKDARDVRLLTAPVAFMHFDTHEGTTYVTAHLINPILGRTGSQYLVQLTSQELPSVELPNPAREEPSWYDWGKLLRTLRAPQENREIRRRLVEIRREMRHDMVVQDVLSTIADHKPYMKLVDVVGGDTYVVSAAEAEMGKSGQLKLLSGTTDGGQPQRVAVTVRRDGQVYRRISGNEGIITATWSARQRLGESGGGMAVRAQGEGKSESSFVTIELRGNVALERPAQSGSRPLWRGEWVSPQLPIPSDILDKAKKISLADIWASCSDIDSVSRPIRKKVRKLQTRVPKLRSEILAEIHGRIAYGLSCFMLVALGAALGMIYRGGQVISAFALMIVPAAVVIVMVIMGKQMVTNPDVSQTAGLAVMWSGIALLLAGTVFVYLRMMKR